MNKRQNGYPLPNRRLLMAGLALAVLVTGIIVVVRLVSRPGAGGSAGEPREALSDRSLLATRPIETAHFRTTRGLDDGELQRIARFKTLVRSGEQPPQPLATSAQRGALWYDEGARVLNLPDQQQMTDGELTSYLAFTDAFGKRSVTISAVGDILLGGDKRQQDTRETGAGMTSYDWFEKLKNDNGGLKYFLADVAPIFQADDLTICNLEGTLTNQTKNGEGLCFSAPPKYAKALKNAGIDACNLANNHSDDFFRLGLEDTRDALRRAGIARFHTGSNNTAEVTTDNRVQIGLISSTMPVKMKDLKLGIEGLRAGGCDIVIASFHWTNSQELTNTVSAEEQRIARAAIDYGADLVLGHHKHLLSGLEKYNGKMIVYDLGNFLSTNVPLEALKYTMIYQQTFNVFEDGEAVFSGFKIIPCLNSDALGDAPNNGRVHPADPESSKRIVEQIKQQTPQQELWPLIEQAL